MNNEKKPLKSLKSPQRSLNGAQDHKRKNVPTQNDSTGANPLPRKAPAQVTKANTSQNATQKNPQKARSFTQRSNMAPRPFDHTSNRAAQSSNAAQKPSPFPQNATQAKPRVQAQTSKKQAFPFLKKKGVDEPKKRRRNDESYVFSRSLSETQERILEERRERLEDAKQFQKEDVNQKLKFGALSFIGAFVLVSLIVLIIVSSLLSGEKIKKNKGEYIYSIGSTSENAAYADAIHNDKIYISMNSIAELCELTLSGTSSDLRFTAKSGDWISFSPDSTKAKINGYSITMPAPAYIKDVSCSVPLEFIEYVLAGIEVSIDYKENEISIRRIEYDDSTPLEPHYVDISFQLKIDTALSPLDENKYFAGKPLFTFKNDLTAYEKYMNPSNASAYLVLINKQNPAGSDYVPPEELVYVNDDGDRLVETAAKALEAMLIEMKSEGFTDIYVTSAYRPYSYQVALYYTYVDNEMAKNPSLTQEEAEKIVQTYSAVPGESEHQSGLCVDFISSSMTSLDETFADNEAYDWLLANAWKFGYILRYPEDKVDITEYSFEPWHWRFVGRDAALEMLRSAESFEEYIARVYASKEEQ